MVMKSYPPEFKAEAVALYRSRPSATIAQIADDLGLNRETMRNWIRADERATSGRSDQPTTPVATTATSGLETQNGRLKQRIRELEEERDILRKAARYFAGETRW
jgi:transposase